MKKTYVKCPFTQGLVPFSKCLQCIFHRVVLYCNRYGRVVPNEVCEACQARGGTGECIAKAVASGRVDISYVTDKAHACAYPHVLNQGREILPLGLDEDDDLFDACHGDGIDNG